MNLLVTFIVLIVIGMLASVAIGLTVERLHSSYVGLLAFIPTYFAMFWVAWKVAVRITEPKAAPKTTPPA